MVCEATLYYVESDFGRVSETSEKVAVPADLIGRQEILGPSG